MEIVKLSLSGFCNIKQFDISLTDFNALVAPNNYGKSNVLEGIIFAFRYISASEEHRKSMMNDASFIPINVATSGMPFRFAIELKECTDNDSVTYNYEFGFEWAKTNGEQGAYIIEELLTERSSGSRRQHMLIKRDKGNGGFYVPSHTGRCNKEANATDIQMVINLLSNNDGLYYSNAIRQLNALSMSMVGSPNFDKQGLCGFVYNLREQHPERYSLFENAVEQIVPGIQSIIPTCSRLGLENSSIPYRVDDAIYDIRVNESSNNQDISISRLSSGSRRIIAIIADIIKAEMAGCSIICMEELENSVHPKLLEDMILLVKSFAEGVKVIITSHSPYLVRYLKSRNLIFGLQSENNVAMFRKIKSSKVKRVMQRANAMEQTLGEYMFELMLEMDKDADEIDELFE